MDYSYKAFATEGHRSVHGEGDLVGIRAARAEPARDRDISLAPKGFGAQTWKSAWERLLESLERQPSWPEARNSLRTANLPHHVQKLTMPKQLG